MPAARPGAARLLRAGKFLLAALPLAWILGRIDPAQFQLALAHAAWWTWPFVVVSFYGGMGLQGLRWWATQRALIPGLPLGPSLAQHFVASAYAVVLPGSFAQDLLRAGMASRQGDAAVSWGAAWVTRITGLLAWAVLTLGGLALTRAAFLPPEALQVGGVAVAALGLLVALSFSKTLTRPLRRLATHVLPARVLRAIEDCREAVYQYRHRRRALAGLLLAAVAVQLYLVAGAAVTVYAISGVWALADLLAFVPLIEIVLVALPLTPGGLGMREGLLAALFAQLGLSAAQTGIYVAIGLLGMVLRAAGGLPFMLRRGPRRPAGAR